MNIVAGCGFYVEATHPARLHRWSVEDIAGEMIRDLTEGMDGTGIKAGVIGELGVTRYPMGPAERKVFQAAALAQQEVGCAIIAHSAAGADSPLEVIDVLSDAGADMSKVVQSHLDDRFRSDLDRYRRALESGAGLGLDTFGRELYYAMRKTRLPSDEDRMDALFMLIESGMADRIFPAQDICFKHELATYGGHGYDHFLRYIVPRLEARGVSGADLDTLLRKNPSRLLAGPPVSATAGSTVPSMSDTTDNDILSLVAWVRVEPGGEDAVREALVGFVAPTLEEEGCIDYQLHAVNDDPGLFYFVEYWRSEEDLERHIASPHIRDGGAAVRHLIQESGERRMTRIA